MIFVLLLCSGNVGLKTEVIGRQEIRQLEFAHNDMLVVRENASDGIFTRAGIFTLRISSGVLTHVKSLYFKETIAAVRLEDDIFVNPQHAAPPPVGAVVPAENLVILEGLLEEAEHNKEETAQRLTHVEKENTDLVVLLSTKDEHILNLLTSQAQANEVVREVLVRTASSLCMTCNTREKNRVMKPCGHALMCDICVKSWQSTPGGDTCPGCRKKIDTIENMHLSC